MGRLVKTTMLCPWNYFLLTFHRFLQLLIYESLEACSNVLSIFLCFSLNYQNYFLKTLTHIFPIIVNIGDLSRITILKEFSENFHLFYSLKNIMTCFVSWANLIPIDSKKTLILQNCRFFINMNHKRLFGEHLSFQFHIMHQSKLFLNF